jgi:hypothetical protein
MLRPGDVALQTPITRVEQIDTFHITEWFQFECTNVCVPLPDQPLRLEVY